LQHGTDVGWQPFDDWTYRMKALESISNVMTYDDISVAITRLAATAKAAASPRPPGAACPAEALAA